MESRKEYDILKEVDHPNIVKVHDFVSTDSFNHIIMEYAEGVELQKLKGLRSDQIKEIMKQLLQAVDYLHKKFVCHRDIKPENVLVHIDQNDTITLKLIDFNVSQKCDSKFQMITVKGTKIFMAPELVENRNFNEKIDIWSIGCIMFYLLKNKIPDNGAKIQDDFYKICPNLNEELETLSIDEQNLLQGLLDPNMNTRLSAESALNQ